MSVLVLTALGTVVWFLLQEAYKENKEFKREVLQKLDDIHVSQINLEHRVRWLENRRPSKSHRSRRTAKQDTCDLQEQEDD